MRTKNLYRTHFIHQDKRKRVGRKAKHKGGTQWR